MRVGVYAIALNEADHAARWAESARDADIRLVLDTGSTDDTVRILRDAGVTVLEQQFNPWRFDTARNAALDALPDDLDWHIALDLDEELQPGWRAALEQADPSANRARYEYTWSWNPDGTPGLMYGGDKIHRRGFRWKHPVHEVLVTDVEIETWVDLRIHHHSDSSKPRSSYLPLLALAVHEDPDDDRNAHYYARELMYAGRLDEAVTEFRRHLALPRARWYTERAWSMRYLARCEPDQAERWLLRAAGEAPDYREPWVDLARHYRDRNWELCLATAQRALSIDPRQLEYLTEADAWGAEPHDLAALASFYLGRREDAVSHGVRAVELNPTDERLAANLKFYRCDLANH